MHKSRWVHHCGKTPLTSHKNIKNIQTCSCKSLCWLNTEKHKLCFCCKCFLTATLQYRLTVQHKCWPCLASTFGDQTHYTRCLLGKHQEENVETWFQEIQMFSCSAQSKTPFRIQIVPSELMGHPKHLYSVRTTW